jgi:hypothetical protein
MVALDHRNEVSHSPQRLLASPRRDLPRTKDPFTDARHPLGSVDHIQPPVALYVRDQHVK